MENIYVWSTSSNTIATLSNTEPAAGIEFIVVHSLPEGEGQLHIIDGKLIRNIIAPAAPPKIIINTSNIKEIIDGLVVAGDIDIGAGVTEQVDALTTTIETLDTSTTDAIAIIKADVETIGMGVTESINSMAAGIALNTNNIMSAISEVDTSTTDAIAIIKAEIDSGIAGNQDENNAKLDTILANIDHILAGTRPTIAPPDTAEAIKILRTIITNMFDYVSHSYLNANSFGVADHSDRWLHVPGMRTILYEQNKLLLKDRIAPDEGVDSHYIGLIARILNRMHSDKSESRYDSHDTKETIHRPGLSDWNRNNVDSNDDLREWGDWAPGGIPMQLDEIIELHSIIVNIMSNSSGCSADEAYSWHEDSFYLKGMERATYMSTVAMIRRWP